MEMVKKIFLIQTLFVNIFYNHINNYFRFLLIQMFMYVYSIVFFLIFL